MRTCNKERVTIMTRYTYISSVIFVGVSLEYELLGYVHNAMQTAISLFISLLYKYLFLTLYIIGNASLYKTTTASMGNIHTVFEHTICFDFICNFCRSCIVFLHPPSQTCWYLETNTLF